MPDVNEQTVEIQIPTDNPQTDQQPEQPQHGGLSTSSPQKYLCGIGNCKQSFDSMDLLKEHLKTIHANLGGRPCKFCDSKEKYLEITNDYLKKSRQKTGEKVAIPFIEELADILDVDSDTVHNWTKKTLPDSEELEHPEFVQKIKSIMNLQKLRLLQRTIGRFNPTGAIFQLKTNHGMIETDKRILAGDNKEPLIIEIVNDDKNKGSENE